MTEHTKGPWTVHRDEESDIVFVRAAERVERPICMVVTPVGTSPGENAANARLMAAAPKLLGALRKMRQTHGCNCGCCFGCRAAEAAIREATEER